MIDFLSLLLLQLPRHDGCAMEFCAKINCAFVRILYYSNRKVADTENIVLIVLPESSVLSKINIFNKDNIVHLPDFLVIFNIIIIQGQTAIHCALTESSHQKFDLIYIVGNSKLGEKTSVKIWRLMVSLEP